MTPLIAMTALLLAVESVREPSSRAGDTPKHCRPVQRGVPPSSSTLLPRARLAMDGSMSGDTTRIREKNDSVGKATLRQNCMVRAGIAAAVACAALLWV